MRVALITQFAPPVVGGIQTHISRLQQELSSRGNTVDILGGAASSLPALNLLPRMRWELESYDVVHFHGFERLLLLSLFAHRPRRLVVTPHGGVLGPSLVPGVANRAKTWIDRTRLLPLLSRIAHAIVALHETERRLLQSFGVPDWLLHTVPNGVDIQLQRAVLPSDYLLYAGRVTRAKGLDKCIELVRLLPSMHLKVAGPYTGRVRNWLETKCRLIGVENRVQFLGVVPPEELRRLRRHATANVLFSTYDHQPLAVLEALASGVLSVGSGSVGILELARTFPELVRTADSLSDAANMISADRALSLEERERRRAATVPLLQAYSWPHVGSALERIYSGEAA